MRCASLTKVSNPTQANVYVPQDTPFNAIQLRNLSVSEWQGLPPIPNVKAPAPAPRTPVVATPTAAPAKAPVAAARVDEQPLTLRCSAVQGYTYAPLNDELTEVRVVLYVV